RAASDGRSRRPSRLPRQPLASANTEQQTLASVSIPRLCRGILTDLFPSSARHRTPMSYARTDPGHPFPDRSRMQHVKNPVHHQDERPKPSSLLIDVRTRLVWVKGRSAWRSRQVTTQVGGLYVRRNTQLDRWH